MDRTRGPMKLALVATEKDSPQVRCFLDFISSLWPSFRGQGRKVERMLEGVESGTRVSQRMVRDKRIDIYNGEEC